MKFKRVFILLIDVIVELFNINYIRIKSFFNKYKYLIALY